MTSTNNKLDQALDVAGSVNQQSNLVKSDEINQLGSRIAGQLGFNASIINSGTTTISGLTGMTDQSVGRFLTLFGANNSNNNGTFLISTYNSSSSVDIINLLATTDINNSNINWLERNSYSLEDDINFIRTDRLDIKGVDYFASVPTYVRPSDTTTHLPVNLSNIAGHTTDARALVNTRKYESASTVNGQSFIFIPGMVGEFPYAKSVNRLGVPINDGVDAGNLSAVYCDIIDQSDGVGFNVLTGTHAGDRIFGFSRKGGTGVDGNSFEVELRSIKDGYDIATSVSYTWEIGQPVVVDIYFPFRESFADMDESALRTMVVHGVTAGGISVKPTDIGQFLYSVDSDNLVFTPERPIITDEGFLMVNEDDVVIVQ